MAKAMLWYLFVRKRKHTRARARERKEYVYQCSIEFLALAFEVIENISRGYLLIINEYTQQF